SSQALGTSKFANNIMGCICSTPSTTDSPRNSRPRKEPCFRLFRKAPLQLTAQTSEIHDHAVATISNGGSVTKFKIALEIFWLEKSIS
ncbi:hypothetical protein SO802_020141, partial [Lithocarpus litseifolius]